jgi:hypothetical protein
MTTTETDDGDGDGDGDADGDRWKMDRPGDITAGR